MDVDPDLIKPGISSFPWPIWDSTAGLLKPDGPFSHYHGGSRNVP
jgi:hypothetical protein